MELEIRHSTEGEYDLLAPQGEVAGEEGGVVHLRAPPAGCAGRGMG